MPGVKITTSVRSGPASSTGSDEATFLAVGQTERGPLTAKFVYSLADYVATFGDRVAYGLLYDQVRTFFEEGGYRVGISRVVGPAATVGTLTLKDRAGAGGVNTVRIDALNPGAWSTRVSISVADGVIANTVTVSVLYDQAVTEVFANLANPAAIVAALAGSKYVKATDLVSATAAPNNNPAVLAGTALSAGADDRGSILTAHYLAALEDFDDDTYGPGLVAIPGLPATTVAAGLIAHCQAHNNRVAWVSMPIGTDLAGVKAAANTIQVAQVNGAGLEFIGLGYPGVVIPDTGGVTRIISNEGFVAAMRSRAIVTEGVWRAPIGPLASAQFVIGQELPIVQADGDALDAAWVSAIRQIGGLTTLYGWRSLSLDTVNYLLLKDRDLLNAVEVEAQKLGQRYVGATVDSSLRVLGKLQGDLIGLLQPLVAAGGLFAAQDGSDPGYSVDVSPAAGNTPVNLAAGKIGAVVSVRPSPTAELINITVVRVSLTSSV